MAFDPEEFVTLTDHGSMKLRAAVLRAMTLLPKERKRTTIVRNGEPAILNSGRSRTLQRSGTNGSCQSTDWFSYAGFVALVSIGPRTPKRAARARPRQSPLNLRNGDAVL
jgi:hypothetical protein